MKTILTAMLIILGMITAKSQTPKAFESLDFISKDNLSEYVPLGYEKVFENISYTYYKNRNDVFAFGFYNGKLKSIVFTDKTFLRGKFEKWNAGLFLPSITAFDTKDYVIVKKEKEYILFNKSNL